MPSLFSDVAHRCWVVCTESANQCHAIFRKNESLRCTEQEAYIHAWDRLETSETNIACGNCEEGVITLFDYITPLFVNLNIMTYTFFSDWKLWKYWVSSSLLGFFFGGENAAWLEQKTGNQRFVCHPKKQTKNIKCHVLIKYSVLANTMFSVLYRLSERAAISGCPLISTLCIRPFP